MNEFWYIYFYPSSLCQLLLVRWQQVLCKMFMLVQQGRQITECQSSKMLHKWLYFPGMTNLISIAKQKLGYKHTDPQPQTYTHRAAMSFKENIILMAMLLLSSCPFLPLFKILVFTFPNKYMPPQCDSCARSKGHLPFFPSESWSNENDVVRKKRTKWESQV